MPEEIVSTESQIHSHCQFGIRMISGSDRPASISRWNPSLSPSSSDCDAHFHFHKFNSIHGVRVCLLCFNLSSYYRIALAFTGIGLLVVGTTVVGYLPNGR